MILSLKNEEGFIYSYLEWDLVDKDGSPHDYGCYVYIRDLWVHDSFDGREIILHYIQVLLNDRRTRFVRYVYWLRNGERISRLFKVSTIKKKFLNEIRR